MYFFIDPANLTSQLVNDAYGPLSTNLNNIYNTTSRFQLLNEAKAFACRAGTMIVQQSVEDTSLVNLVIRPNGNDLKIPLTVEYYIYRGLLKSSLISSDESEIQPLNPTTSNELIQRMRTDSLTTDFTSKMLGFDSSLSDNNLLDDFFSFKNNQVYLAVVKEGEWIGTFTKDHKIGFEIVLKSDFNKFDLGFLRAANHQINVTGLNGFTQRLKREEILKFIDPAAFFGLHHLETIDYYDAAAPNNKQTTTKKVTGSGSDRFIYTKIIEKFHTRNKVYVDIRSEKGYSYNFYQNYKVSSTDVNNIQISPAPGTGALNFQEYLTNEWPIIIVESTDTSGDSNKLRMKLRIGATDNLKPILYTATKLEKTLSSSTKLKSRYIKTKELIGNGTNPSLSEWTNEFRIYFPNTQYGNGTASSRNYISNYARLHYFRTVHNANNVNPSVLENKHYYDSAFCSIDIPEFDLPDNLDVGHVESVNPIYVREPLHYNANHSNYDVNYNIEGTGNFELNMINGAYWGNGRILMYARIEYENTEKTSEKEYLNTYDQNLSSFTQNYSYRLVRERLKFISRRYDITGNPGNTIIPGINFFRSNDLGAGKNHKENCMLLGLTIDEMISVKADSQLSNGHQRFIHLEPLVGNPQQDNNNNRYFAFTVRIQGFDANQDSIIVTPQHNGSNIVVYSRDNQFFSSYEFSKDEAVTAGQNRVEFHIYHDGVIKITDNIDMTLIHDIQNIYYKYRATNNGAFVDICNLNLIMANKMKNGVYFNSATHGALTTFTLNHINHDQEATNAGIENVNADNSFENTDGGVMTDGYFKPKGSSYGLYRRYYENTDKKTFLVHFVEATINASPLTIVFSYDETLRHYARPELAAAVMGALIQLGNAGFISTGFSYRNSTCYPSVSHVNGEAIDTKYKNNSNDNQDIIDALHDFGFNYILKGTNPAFATLTFAVADSAHNDHLHSGRLVLNDALRIY